MNPLICSLAVWSFLACPAFGANLYLLNFDPPTHTVGAPAKTGNFSEPNSSPSGVNFGTSLVVPTFAGSPDPALQLIPDTQSTFHYSQYHFDLTGFDPNPIYRVDFDLILSNFHTDGGEFQTSNTEDNFSIIFDTPSVVRLDFTDLGYIHASTGNVGTFQFDQPMHVTALVNLALNQWNILMDGADVFQGQFFHIVPAHPIPPTAIHSIRINLADSVFFPEIPVALIDDFTIQGIPEPSCAGLLIYSGALWLVRRRFSE